MTRMALCSSLAIRGLQKFHLQRMDLEIEPGDLVSLRGRNQGVAEENGLKSEN